ncbi:MAG: hypothetical protein HZB75_01800 [Candidatus Saccharibacteria bacterium]|nr:MAG: hypothetical protein HZB75_01800 [Candidatus Saccharibacteria bacterium]
MIIILAAIVAALACYIAGRRLIGFVLPGIAGKIDAWRERRYVASIVKQIEGGDEWLKVRYAGQVRKSMPRPLRRADKFDRFLLELNLIQAIGQSIGGPSA